MEGRIEEHIENGMEEIMERANKKSLQLQNDSIVALKKTFRTNQIELLFKFCRCPELIHILIEFQCLYFQQSALRLPFNADNWLQASFLLGSNLIYLLKLQNSQQAYEQLQMLLSYLYKHTNIKQDIKKQESIDLMLLIYPLYVIEIYLSNFLSDSEKYSSEAPKNLYCKAFELMKLKQILKYFGIFKANKNLMLAIVKKQDYQPQIRKAQLLQLTTKISVEAHKYVVQGSMQLQLKNFKQKLQKGSIDQINIKSLKKVNDQIKQILQSYYLYGQAVSNRKFIKIYKEKPDLQSPTVVRRKTIESSKRKKLLQITDPKLREQYYQDLKNTLKKLCMRLQNQSKKKQQEWKILHQQNKFWVSSKIKNNQCYEIHPKITGFYRLNIVKTAFDEIPYPRRKSFEHQLVENNEQEVEMLQKISGSQLIKNLMPNQQSQIAMERSTSATLLHQSTNLKADLKIPKDAIFAQYVTQRGVYARILFYSAQDQCLVFKCKGYGSLPTTSNVYQLSTIFHRIDDLQFKIAILVSQRTQIFARKDIHRHTAIEVFSHKKSYFFNFFFKEVRDKFFKNYSSKFNCIPDLRAQFEKRRYTQKWKSGDLDNFQYLMLVNIFAGRTHNDLAQYPVMPWVITNYDLLDCEINKQFLKDPKNMRDLSKPSGKLNPKKFENLKMRCMQIQPQDQQSKFLYGTMYSNPTVIYNFFIRLQPFTTLHWQHQGRRIDHADRLFSAIRDQFNTGFTSTSDNKQLVPEFYYWPQFLKNRNKVYLGIKQNKQQVHDVRLPGWAKNPEQFIFKMRQILQSPDVTNHLHEWIDLIFGYKSPREVALEYDNLFHFRSYEHDIFETEESQQAIKGAQISISQFGQIPYQLFQKPHPQKNLGYSQNFKLDTPITIRKQSSKRIVHFQMPNEGIFISYDKQVEFYYLQNARIIDSTVQKPTKSFVSDGPIVKLSDFNSSIWFTLKEGTFRIFDKKQCVLEADLEMQCFANFGRYILYGFRSELIVTKIQSTYRISKISSLFGHKSNIYLIKVCILLDVVLNVDEAGLVLVHEFSKQKLMREFQLGVDLKVTDLCIHEMGYFIFFKKCQKLIIYTQKILYFRFLGQIFFNQDIGITNKAISQNITKVSIFQHNRSLLLISTDKGKIYLIDFLQIKRFNQNCVYKEFSRFKNNILQNCARLGSSLAIRDFYVRKIPGKDVITYKFYVLYENNQIICYYSSQQFQVKLKNNKM